MGVYTAFRLLAWPQVLDALAALAPGKVSRVVETEFGFHVFQRRLPAKDAAVSGRRIIIGHDDAPWLGKHLARGSVPPRPRPEALALATQIYEAVRTKPEQFEHFVQEHSEHRDALRGGDFGEWSTREPTPFRAAVEMLSRLDIGEIAPPVDSAFGYQIIQRTPHRRRVTYGLQSIRVPFNPFAPETHPQSRQGSQSLAQSISHALVSEPERFGEFQQQYCCLIPEIGVEGRGSAPVERALLHLAVGEIDPEPIEDSDHFVIIQRLRPQSVPPTQLLFDLPAPERPDVEYLVTHSGWLAELDEARQAARHALHLDPVLASRIDALYEPIFVQESAEEERVTIYRRLQQQLRELLGAEGHLRYADVVETYFRERLMGE